jgi:hypothetical protein
MKKKTTRKLGFSKKTVSNLQQKAVKGGAGTRRFTNCAVCPQVTDANTCCSVC